jgi:hypothetical protein
MNLQRFHVIPSRDANRSQFFGARRPSGIIKTSWTTGHMNYYSLRLNMNKSPAMTALLVLLVVSALCSVAFCGLYVRDAMRLRDLQRSTSMVQAYRSSMLSLISDTLEYSKRNPSIDPILEAAGFKPKPGGAAVTNKPAGK